MAKPVAAELMTSWQEQTQRVAHGIRCRVLELTITHNGGYLSQACSSADILATLYTRLMRLGPSEGPRLPRPYPGPPGVQNPAYFNGRIYNGPVAPDLDRFILSPSHYALALYATLVETGRLAPEGLDQFNQDGSSVEMIGAEHSPGIEIAGGSFGQALAQAAGIAAARKLRRETGSVYVFMSDGEFQEGQTWETLLTTAFHKVDNLRVFVDVNGQQVDGRMDRVMNLEPFQAKLEAFGMRVVRVDGHDLAALAEAPEHHKPGQPLIVLAYTQAFRGIEILRERGTNLHYIRFRDEAERQRYRVELRAMRAREA